MFGIRNYWMGAENDAHGIEKLLLKLK
jgi:hypothetical protein